MTLRNLIQTTLWPEVKAALLSLFPDEEANLEPNEGVFRGLRLIVPGSSDMRWNNATLATRVHKSARTQQGRRFSEAT